VEDVGTHSAESVDWPEIGARVAARISAEPDKLRGVVICGTGLGMSMICNKFRKVRAALCHTRYDARMSRQHNNANILNLGGRVLRKKQARGILDVWLRTDFEGGRHQRRLDIFSRLEKENCK
jgi:ribose 5-phosphate isomerase B